MSRSTPRVLAVVFVVILTVGHVAALGGNGNTPSQRAIISPSSWPMFRADPAHSGYNPFETTLTPPLKLKWSYSTGEEVRTSPAVVEGVVYFGSYDRSMYAVRADTGALKWSYQTGGAIESAPAVVDGAVFFGSEDGKIYALRADNGAPIWAYATGKAVISSPTVVSGIVYVGSSSGKLYALKATTGEVVWSFNTGASNYPSPAVVAGTAFFADEDKLYAFEAGTGRHLWTTQLVGGSFDSSPAVAGGTVYIWCAPKLCAFNATTGEAIWSYATGAGSPSSPAVSHGTLYFGSFDHKIYAVNAATGSLKWTYPTGGIIVSSPSVANGIVYVGSNDGKFYAFRAETGEVAWVYDIGRAIQSSAAIAGGDVYIGSMTRKLYAFTAATIPTPTPVAPTATPTRTPIPPTATSVPPTATSTRTPVPPTATSVPPTATPIPIDQLPTIAFPAEGQVFTARLGETFSLQVLAGDPEGQSLVYLPQTWPTTLQLGQSTGLITWTPSYDFVDRRVQVTFYVSDRPLGQTSNPNREVYRTFSVDVLPSASTATPTSTPTRMPVPPTATATRAPSTATPTRTQVPPSATPTRASVSPTATPTSAPPTATPTRTAVPPTATPPTTQNAANLSEYYLACGKSLPPLLSRAKLYEGLGLGAATDYAGTAEQNTQLLSALKQAQTCASTIQDSGPVALNSPIDIPRLRSRIDRLLQRPSGYPPYRRSPLLFGETADIYDQSYQAGVDYDTLSVRTLIRARSLLAEGNAQTAAKYADMSLRYAIMSDTSFKAAVEVYAGNLEGVATSLATIKDLACWTESLGWQLVDRGATKVVGLDAAKAVEYICSAFDIAIDYSNTNMETAARNALLKLTVKVLFESVPFDELDGRTMAGYTENRVGKLTFPVLQKLFQNDERKQWLFSRLVKTLAVDIEEEVAGQVALSVLNQLGQAVDVVKATVKSPVELRVYDSTGRMTGLQNGEMRNEIPRSFYDNEVVEIYFPSESYRYEAVGIQEGTYAMEISSVREGQANTLTFAGVPTSGMEVHEYTVDWSALSQGAESKKTINLRVDSDGDGTFERTGSLLPAESGEQGVFMWKRDGPRVPAWVWFAGGALAASLLVLSASLVLGRRVLVRRVWKQ